MASDPECKIFYINLDWASKVPIESNELHLGRIDNYDVTLHKKEDNTRYIAIHYPLHISC